jgi:hypothetical protein
MVIQHLTGTATFDRASDSLRVLYASGSLKGCRYSSLAFGQHLKPFVNTVVYRSKTTNQPTKLGGSWYLSLALSQHHKPLKNRGHCGVPVKNNQPTNQPTKYSSTTLKPSNQPTNLPLSLQVETATYSVQFAISAANCLDDFVATRAQYSAMGK